MPLEVSYYRGSDWSEGSTSSSKIVFNVPAGNYFLSIKSQAGGAISSKLTNYQINLYRDVVIARNFWISMFLIIIIPFFSFFKKRGFEVKRWSNSDYSPYFSEE